MSGCFWVKRLGEYLARDNDAQIQRLAFLLTWRHTMNNTILSNHKKKGQRISSGIANQRFGNINYRHAKRTGDGFALAGDVCAERIECVET